MAGEFGIYVDTTSSLPNIFDPDLPGIYHSAYYNSTESMTYAQDAEVFAAGATYIGKDITLIPTLTVNVIIQSPSGESFDVDQDLVTNLFGNVTSEAGQIHWTYAQGGGTTCLAGSEQCEFTFETTYYIEGDFIIQYKFSNGSDLGFLTKGYYSDSGPVPTADQAAILSSNTSKLDLNMILSKSAPLNGTSRLVPMIDLLLLNN